MPLRPCLGLPGITCGRLSSGPRCPEHQRARAYAQQRGKRERRPYSYADRKRRAEAVRLHVEQFGWVCPGWKMDAHPSQDLTADHVVSFAALGSEHSSLIVLCRSCNSSKGQDSLRTVTGGWGAGGTA